MNRNELVDLLHTNARQIVRSKGDWGEFIRGYSIFLNVVTNFVLTLIKDPLNRGKDMVPIVNDAIEYILHLV